MSGKRWTIASERTEEFSAFFHSCWDPMFRLPSAMMRKFCCRWNRKAGRHMRDRRNRIHCTRKACRWNARQGGRLGMETWGRRLRMVDCPTGGMSFPTKRGTEGLPDRPAHSPAGAFRALRSMGTCPVIQRRLAGQSRIASAAPLVTIAAQDGDPLALDILHRAADELYGLVASIVRQLPELGSSRLVNAGGVLRT
jgi:hypothetical protein